MSGPNQALAIFHPPSNFAPPLTQIFGKILKPQKLRSLVRKLSLRSRRWSSCPSKPSGRPCVEAHPAAAVMRQPRRGGRRHRRHRRRRRHHHRHLGVSSRQRRAAMRDKITALQTLSKGKIRWAVLPLFLPSLPTTPPMLALNMLLWSFSNRAGQAWSLF